MANGRVDALGAWFALVQRLVNWKRRLSRKEVNPANGLITPWAQRCRGRTRGARSHGRALALPTDWLTSLTSFSPRPIVSFRSSGLLAHAKQGSQTCSQVHRSDLRHAQRCSADQDAHTGSSATLHVRSGRTC
jgi:hypothetical protein